MAIDYGRVRTGLAVTDPMRIIATALATVDTPKLMDYLRTYCNKEEVDIFVVGIARHLDGTPSESMQLIEPFAVALGATFPDKRVARIDERFTSKMAQQAILASGIHKKERRDKGRIDRVAATIMLQDFMRMNNI